MSSLATPPAEVAGEAGWPARPVVHRPVSLGAGEQDSTSGPNGEEAAQRRRRRPALRATQRDRLAGNHCRLMRALNLGVLIHHPAHDHGVRINVRSWNIRLRTNEIRYLFDEAAAEFFDCSKDRKS